MREMSQETETSFQFGSFVWIAGHRFRKGQVPEAYLEASQENREIKEKREWSTPGVNYQVARERIIKALEESRQSTQYYTGQKGLAYSITLFTQLENAARIGEALEALYLWLKNNKRELKVRIEKHYGDKEHPTIELRPFYITREILQSDRKPIMKFMDEDLYSGCRSFCFKKLRFSTHTLRHAGITEQMKRLIIQGKNPFLVMRLTGHTSEKMLIHYLQTDELQALMREKLPDFDAEKGLLDVRP